MSTGFDIGARLSRGLSGRLSFDHACNRRRVFSEAYFYGLMMELLASHISPARSVVRVGHPIRAIQDPNRVGGRNREVDFAITSHGTDPDLQAAIEVKWAGSSHCTGPNILKDLVRLSMAGSVNPSARCFFVLAGRRKEVAALFEDGLLRDDMSALSAAHKAWLVERDAMMESEPNAAQDGHTVARVPVPALAKSPTPLRRWNARKRHNEYLLRPMRQTPAHAPSSVVNDIAADYPNFPSSILTTFSDVPGILSAPWPVLVWRVLQQTPRHQ